MLHIFMIALGGGIGASTRYLSVKWIEKVVSIEYPLGILIVNILGSFIVGFFFGIVEDKYIPKNIKSFVTVGFLGAYTSFSTYSLETIGMLEGGYLKLGLLNILLHNGLSLIATILGMFFASFTKKYIKS